MVQSDRKRSRKRNFPYLLFIVLFSGLVLAGGCQKREVNIVVDHPDEAVSFAANKLAASLNSIGYRATVVEGNQLEGSKLSVSLQLDKSGFKQGANEAFHVGTSEQGLVISGSDPSGVLYGCIELIERIEKDGQLPVEIDYTDQPDMVLRGTCIGLQKTEYLPGRDVYEYPYTPENFPWFYDKQHWIDYLDMMVENRYNSLYLWNGHPFASLVKLDEYPYAVEVDEETFKKNEEVFAFLTEEAEKRGIWVIQMFYNIIVSKPFAEHHELETQERGRPIIPVISDYTRKSVAAFIEKYPHVGLMVCLGEAMNTYEDDVEWFTETIIPGVRDGMEALGITEEPPIVLRGHDTDAAMVMEAALPLYKNLYTVYKYNGESLTTYEPRNQWASIPKSLSELGSVHISNVHILANLEPFRYGSPDFIQKSTKAMRDIQGANGLHLYPQTSYWDWPYTADKAEPRILQIDRDWMWYETWGRYAWDMDRDRQGEIEHFSERLGDFYGSNKEQGNNILVAYEESGEIAPKLLRRFGISDGNRQTLLLGMFMSQLVNPFKWNVYQSYLDSNGPEGEILVDWARKEWKGEPHIGETPPQIIEEVLQHGEKAVEAIDKAAKSVSENKDEFDRLRNDMYCYRETARFFAEKVKAAQYVLRYKYSADVADLEKALPHLEKSVEHYGELVKLTQNHYLYANSMQTTQRRIPIFGTDATNKTWVELMVHYEDELVKFRNNVEKLKEAGGEAAKKYGPYKPVNVQLQGENVKRYTLKPGSKVSTDKNNTIIDVAPELQQLEGVMLSDADQQKNGTEIRFVNEKPVKVVVGYFTGHSFTILPPPRLETNAQANNRGQADIKISNALKVKGLYGVNVYTYDYEAGENMLKLNPGRVMILGFIDGNEEIEIHDAGIGVEGDGLPVDWLFN
ncbi:alpha-d-galacturonidase [Roseimarinus sediminis]|uniref:alpha-d-galacturonidase n=1 Tax=Roseimarinus sediminis TaxID=1610899 RepID=UPI003D1CF349